MPDSGREGLLEIFGKAKNLGIRGSSTLAFSFIIFPILVPCIVGAMLVFNSLRGLAECYGEEKMFGYAFGVFPYAIGHALSMIMFLSVIVAIVASHGPKFLPWLLLGFPPMLIVVCFLPSLMGAILLGRAFDILSKKSGEGMFRKIGLLLPADAISKLMGAGLRWNPPFRPTEAYMYVLFLISMMGAVSIVAWMLAAKAFSRLTFGEFFETLVNDSGTACSTCQLLKANE